MGDAGNGVNTDLASVGRGTEARFRVARGYVNTDLASVGRGTETCFWVARRYRRRRGESALLLMCVTDALRGQTCG